MDAVTLALIKSMAGGSSLPSVTSADNGKVLGVVDGAWAADENVFIVTFTFSGGYKADKTFAEISDAMSANKRIIGVYGTSNIYECTKSSSGFSFSSITGKVSVSAFIVGPNNVVQQAQGATVEAVLNNENGYELVSSSGKWVKQAKKFIVTLTPTSPDYSGTMDKTPEEITAAYNAGQEIVFDIPALSAKINANQFLVGNDVIRAGSMVFYDVNSSPVIITVVTGSSASTYATQIFAMTPAS